MNLTRLSQKLFSNNRRRKAPYRPLKFNDRQRFLILLNYLGYILLVVSLIDYLLILYPLQITDAEWELQTFDRMVEHAWLVLLGLILTFLPTQPYIHYLKLKLLRFLRWIAILIALLFLFLIPLGLVNSQRVYQQSVQELTNERNAQIAELNNIEESVQTQDIPPNRLEQLGENLELSDPTDEENIRAALIEEIEGQKRQVQIEFTIDRNQRLRQLILQAVRTNVGAFLIAAFLFGLWRETKWVKKKGQKRKVRASSQETSEGL
ncbi:MAG: HpsJ family protein [Halothece sp.]